ncbi:MAG TPA: hypothetical protein EYG11_15460 [Candidatus Latescibacteria bacterium]|nr:hypothetical protein [Candidatus Handelsmanbacteria bacterium]HIL10095.1 hypothetical protein [Candidatus Latescibacterota bacterium]
MDKLNIAVVGLRFGKTWMNGLRRHPNCRLACLCDSDPAALEKGQAESGVNTVASHLEEVLNDPHIDAVALFTPAPLHAEQSEQSAWDPGRLCVTRIFRTFEAGSTEYTPS